MAKFNTQYLIQSIKFLDKNLFEKHEFGVFCALLVFGNTNNNIRVSREAIAEIAGISISTVKRSIALLEHKNYISVWRPPKAWRNYSNQYSINLELFYKNFPYKNAVQSEQNAVQNDNERGSNRPRKRFTETHLVSTKTDTREEGVVLADANSASSALEGKQKQEPYREQTEEENTVRVAENLGITVEELRAKMAKVKVPKSNV